MEKDTIDLVDELNNLVEINNDRSTGYEKAESETKDANLKNLFSRCAMQSKSFNSVLSQEVIKAGGTPTTGTRETGKLYRVWMDLKALLTGNDKKAILSSCEYGEDVAKETYEEFLKTPNIPMSVQALVRSQLTELKSTHDEIRRLRDAA